MSADPIYKTVVTDDPATTGGAIAKKVKTKKVKPPPSEKSETESECTEESEESEASEEEDDDGVSFSTTDILSNDPLYFVLSKIFMTEEKVSIATLLSDISDKLTLLLEKKSKK